MSSFKTHSHVDIQVQRNVVLVICVHVVRINVYACKYVSQDTAQPTHTTRRKSQLCVKINHHYRE